MLTIRAAKGPDYYERAEFARDDYYEERGHVRGSWEGRAAAELGLEDAPEAGELGTLLEGRHPDTDQELAGAARRRGGNVAFDLTFTAPKGLSVLAAVGGEEVRQAVLDAHADGVRAGLDYLERRACFVRRGRNGVRVLPARGFAGAMYVHEMARSGDPHLHAHMVVANRVTGPDGRWSAPDMRPVFAEAKTAGTIAEAATRQALTRTLGLEWGPVKDGVAEPAAVPPRVREHFSARHAEILEEAAVRGYAGPRGIAVIQRETRDRKRVVSRDRAVDEWRARAAEHGLGEREIAMALGRARSRSPEHQMAILAERAEAMVGPAGLTQRAATFTRREVIQGIAEGHPQGAPPAALERLADEFLAGRCAPLAPARVEPGRGYQEALYTTPEMLRVEVRFLEIASGEDPRGPLVAAPDQVQGAIDRRPALGADQREAVRHLTAGEGRTRLLEARAGTGKTFALEAVREAYEASGVPVVGTAWQGQAADVLQREAGISSETAALLLEQAARGEEAIPAGAVVVCDEASTMPTRALERLAGLVAERAGRLVLVGDRAQLPAVDAAGGFAALADRLGAAELVENRRQRTELQRVVADRLAAGRPGDAVAVLAEHGRLHAFADGRDAREALIRSWASTSLDNPSEGLILAHDRREVRLLNDLARAELDAAGRLGEQRMMAEGREWAAGDRLLCRRNDYGLGVRNGTRATVTAIDEGQRALVVRTDDGRDLTLPADYLAHAQHAYAMTGHVSQGTTVDRTYLLATPDRGGREWAYVAGSRQRIDLEVCAVHHEPERLEDALERAWSQTEGKRLALDLAGSDEHDRAHSVADAGLADSLPERLTARIDDLTTRREVARTQARAADPAMAARLAELRAAVSRSSEGARAAKERFARLQGEERALSGWRRRQRTELRAVIAEARQESEALASVARTSAAELERLEAASDPASRGGQAGVRAQELGAELRALELRLGEWSIASELAHPSPALARALGSRPREPEARATWECAARNVSVYRRDRGLARDSDTALGPEPVDPEARAAWERAAAATEQALDDLGRSGSRSLVREIRGVDREPPGLDRD